MERKQTLGLIGAGLLALGVFAPLISLFGLLSLSLSNFSTLDVLIIWALAFVSGLLAYRKMYKPLWATGLLALGWVAFRFFYFQSELGSAFAGQGTEDAFNQGANELAKGLVSMSWGWVVLIAGPALIIAAAVVKEPEKLTMTAGQQ